MGVDIGAQLDLFDLNGLLLLARFGSLFLGLKLILPEVHDFADGDFPVHGDLDQIETGFLRSRYGLALIDCALVLTSLVDELNVAGDNGFINARPFLRGGGASYGTAYLTSPCLLRDGCTAASC
jgi:hypothetical protein